MCRIVRSGAGFAPALVALLGTGPLRAQNPPAVDSTYGGLFFARISARTDSTQTYAMVLPANYSPARKYPLLILLDPRGRALVPLGKFGPPAARAGFVTVSSYNSASDGPIEPTVDAINAMLADAWRALSIDQSRVYLAGFSGTARLSWRVAAELKGVVRGIIALCAGPPAPAAIAIAPFRNDSAFAVFAATGLEDFNHDEVITIDRQLGDVALAHRTIVFPGGHEWGPAAIAAEAIEWLSLREAMAGIRPRDSTAADYRAHRLAEIDALRAGGDTLEAVRRFLSLARDLPTDPAVTRYATGMRAFLARRPDLERDEERLIGRDRDWIRKADDALTSLETTKPRPTVDRLAEQVGLAPLLDEAADRQPIGTRSSARRRLAWLEVNASFYGPRTYLERNAWSQVVVLLDLARRIRPLGPEACQSARAARAGLGQDGAGYPECSAPPAR
jgi:predicted esterase